MRLWNGGGELVQIDAAIIARVNACKNLKELEVSERGGAGKVRDARSKRREREYKEWGHG